MHKMAHETWTTHESWVYQCTRCLETWTEEYDARHVADGHGGEAVAYRHDGQPCISPWCDHMCPRCHGYSVKAFAAPWSRTASAHAGRDIADQLLVSRLRRMGAY